MGDAAAVPDDIQSVMLTAFQLFIHLDLHIVELDLHAVQQGILIGGAGGYFIQCINHLHNIVQNPLGQHQTEVAGGSIQCRGDECLLHALRCGAAPADQIAKALNDHSAAQHIAQPRDALAIAVGVLERL